MRFAKKDNAECAHHWAHQVTRQGHTKNRALFFRDKTIYSYGSHFPIAKHLDGDTVLMTTREYSSTTARHISIVRNAIRHKRIIYCNNPNDSAYDNMAAARYQVRDALAGAARKGIRATTRAKHYARAAGIGTQANLYLSVIPAEERGAALPIDLSNLDKVANEIKEAEALRLRLAAEAHEQRLGRLKLDLEVWRVHGLNVSTGLYDLPVALRLSQDGKRVQTSHGAEITVRDALKLWPLVVRSWKVGKAAVLPREVQVGPYTLNAIAADGSVTIGCHNISFEEMRKIHQQLENQDECAHA